jgi:hypothetical protein
MRIRLRAMSLLIAVPLASLSIAGCSSSGDTSNLTAPSMSCESELATVVHRVRTDDTAGAINSELEWLSQNCAAAYDVFVDYSSARTMAKQSGPETCESLAQYISQDAIALLSEDGLCSGGSAEPQSGSSDPPIQPGGGIAWNEAAKYAGTTQRVCGPLAGTGQSKDDVFLDLGLDYPDPKRFQIVIWDVGTVQPIPSGARLCTSGLITLYNGVPQIELRSASLVEIYN